MTTTTMTTKTAETRVEQLERDLSAVRAKLAKTQEALDEIDALESMTQEDMVREKNLERNRRRQRELEQSLLAELETVRGEVSRHKRFAAEEALRELGVRALAERRAIFERVAELEAEMGERLKDFNNLLREEHKQWLRLNPGGNYVWRRNPFMYSDAGRARVSALEQAGRALLVEWEIELQQQQRVAASEAEAQRQEALRNAPPDPYRAVQVEPDDDKATRARKAEARRKLDEERTHRAAMKRLDEERALERAERDAESDDDFDDDDVDQADVAESSAESGLGANETGLQSGEEA